MILCKTQLLGERLSNISHAIQSYTKSNGLSIAHEYVGLTIGQDLQRFDQSSIRERIRV
jgi:methionine aminopeptidase